MCFRFSTPKLTKAILEQPVSDPPKAIISPALTEAVVICPDTQSQDEDSIQLQDDTQVINFVEYSLLAEIEHVGAEQTTSKANRPRNNDSLSTLDPADFEGNFDELGDQVENIGNANVSRSTVALSESGKKYR
jgi:hypothetical protein